MKTVRAAAAVACRGDLVLAVRRGTGNAAGPAAAAAGQAEVAGEATNSADGAGADGATTSPAIAASSIPAGEASERWEFPNAVLGREETGAAACERALRETADIGARNPRSFYTVEYDAGGQLLSMECFLCAPEANEEGSDPAAGANAAGAGTPAAEAMPAAETEPAAEAVPAAKAASSAPRPDLRWVPRSQLAELAWDPAYASLAGVLAGTDPADDKALIKRRADSRKSLQGNKRAGTKPELLVRQRLREAGLPGYRLQWKQAPGRPDIAYPGRKVAIFVNGCFWHRCPLCQPPVPKRNREFWEAKFARNVERDAQALAELEAQGWTTIVIWECELKRDSIDATMERVIGQVRAAQRPRGGASVGAADPTAR